MKAHSDAPPPECAVCGADIPLQARACPECGADERTGWRESSLYDGLDLPDSAFTYEKDEPMRQRQSADGLAWYWLAAGLLVLLAFGFAVFGLR